MPESKDYTSLEIEVPERTETSVNTLYFRYERLKRENKNLLSQIEFLDEALTKLRFQLEVTESLRDDYRARSSHDSSGRDRLMFLIDQKENEIKVLNSDIERINIRIDESRKDVEFKLSEIDAVEKRLMGPMGRQVNTNSVKAELAAIYGELDPDTIDDAFEDLFGKNDKLDFDN